MFRQFSLVQQLHVCIPDGLRDGRVLDGRHALAMQIVDDLQDAGALLFGGRRRDEVDHCILRRFLEHPRGCPVRVAIDGAGGRIRRARVDLRQAQRDGVGDAIVSAGVHQPHAARQACLHPSRCPAAIHPASASRSPRGRGPPLRRPSTHRSTVRGRGLRPRRRQYAHDCR